MAIIAVDGLSKHFPVRAGLTDRLLRRAHDGVLSAVDNVGFSVAGGETLGIVGESGCGKSTTCLMVARLLTPSAGSVRLLGRDAQAITVREYRRKVQIIFQDPYESLNPRMRVGDIVAEGPRALRLWREPETIARANAMLDRVGLDPARHADAYPHELSGGERQRVGIASALILEPKLVIADEPVSMLDVSIRAEILDLLRSLQREHGFACIYVSHDLSIVANFADRLLVMYLGKTMEMGQTSEVLSRPLNPYTRALVAAIPVPSPGRVRPASLVQGDVAQPINPPPGCRFAARCPQSAPICHQISPDLVPYEPGHLAACHALAAAPSRALRG
jgi:oligopeptide/dipeptide ABC transporter ATP-binding protein